MSLPACLVASDERKEKKRRLPGLGSSPLLARRTPRPALLCLALSDALFDGGSPDLGLPIVICNRSVDSDPRAAPKRLRFFNLSTVCSTYLPTYYYSPASPFEGPHDSPCDFTPQQLAFDETPTIIALPGLAATRTLYRSEGSCQASGRLPLN